MVLVGKPEGRPKRRWEDDIKMDLQEVGYGVWNDRDGSGQEQMAGTCECGNEPLVSIKCEEFIDQLQNQLASQEGLCSVE